MKIWIGMGALALAALSVGAYLQFGAPGGGAAQVDTRQDETGAVQGAVGGIGVTTAPDPTVKGVDAPPGRAGAPHQGLTHPPTDAEGWYALGLAYTAMQRYPDAVDALQRAATLAPKDARILAQLAEALALGSGNLQGRPQQLLAQALELDPDQHKALELAGLAAFQDGKWAESLHYWRRLLRILPSDGRAHAAISQAVRIAERNLDERLRGTGLSGMPEAREAKANPH